MLEIKQGVVDSIVFNNPNNGFVVCKIDCQNVIFTATGIMPGITEGQSVYLEGVSGVHPKYGEQFNVKHFEIQMPSEETHILKYLSSGIIRGVGAATAAKIVNTFGKDAFDIIESSPEQLAKIRGISQSGAKQIHESFLENRMVSNIVMFLAPYGVTPALSVKVCKIFGYDAVSRIKSNPYILCDIPEVGFKTADKIAIKMDVDKNLPERLLHGILYMLSAYAQNGNTFMEKEYLINTAVRFLGADLGCVEKTLSDMLITGQVIKDNVDQKEGIFLPALFYAEQGAAARLHAMMGKRRLMLPGGISHCISRAAEILNIELTDEQTDACKMALTNGVSIITGGPGTGKTTIIKIILFVLKEAGLTAALCAPTGRAAKRMSEACGDDAKTVHRLLEMVSDGDSSYVFSRNEKSPLSEDVIIVDEASMMDISLLYNLLKAIKSGAAVIFAGDADQLPSVGAGNVLRDMITSEIIPVCRLAKIHRQAAQSMIIVNAHRINTGDLPLTGDKNSDFFFIKKSALNDIQQTVLNLVCNKLPDSFGFDPMADIQVITPSRKTPLGTAELAARLQQQINPKSDRTDEITVGNSVFRTGDKVMQIRNNYDIKWRDVNSDKLGNGAFNGDIGFISSIDRDAGSMEVMFDNERITSYGKDDLDQLELAYAVTVHKSQGNEFDAVVIPVFPMASQLTCRNILYTAVTRAKKLAVLVGRNDILCSMIENDTKAQRFSSLKDKITYFTV